MSTFTLGAPDRPIGTIPDFESTFAHPGDYPFLYNNGSLFVVTNSPGVAVAAATINAHPAMSFVGNGTATDGHQATYGGALKFTTGRKVRMYTQFHLTDLTANAAQEFSFGLALTGTTTNVIGSKPADYLLFEHIKTDPTYLTIKALSSGNSNSAQTVAVAAMTGNYALATGSLYDFEFEINPLGSGNATIDVSMGVGLTWNSSTNGQMKYLGRYQLVGSLPDTVNVSPIRAVRQGSTSTSAKFYYGGFAFRQERV